MRWFLLLLLSFFMLGCKPEPPPTSGTYTMTVDQKNYFSFSLPAEWRKNGRGGDLYEAQGQGTLHFLYVGEASALVQNPAPQSGRSFRKRNSTPAKADSGGVLTHVPAGLAACGLLVKSYPSAKLLQAVKLGGGQDGSLVQFSDKQVSYGLTFVFHERQVLVRHYCPPKQREGSPALLTTLAGTIQLDVAPLVAENQQERPSRRRSGGWVVWLGAGLLLLATTAPPYLGARGGYAMAEATGGNVRSGAAQGALNAVCASLTCYTLVLVALLWYWAASAPSGSGVMTPGAASFFVTIFLVLGAIALIAVGGSLAAVGAYLGASRGGSSAGLLAALFTVLGFFVTPALLASRPDHHKSRHHSSLPAAIRVQA